MSGASPLVRAFRSFTALTGILLGAAAAAAYFAGRFAFDVIFGRPSPNEWAGTFIIGLPILGFVLALLGGLAGLVVQIFVRRSRHAGPVDRRTVLVFVTIVAVVAALAGVERGRQIEAPRKPRVIQTSPVIARQQATGDLIPVAPAAMILEPFVPNSADITSLTWHGQRLHLSLTQDVLTIWLGEKELDAVDLRGLDAVTGAFGALATLDDRAWLAILVRLRATGRRELLLIYDPAATLVHKELLQRRGPDGSARLSVAGERGQRQAFLIDVGEPLYFTAAR